VNRYWLPTIRAALERNRTDPLKGVAFKLWKHADLRILREAKTEYAKLK
jgi:hypothetical protein